MKLRTLLFALALAGVLPCRSAHAQQQPQPSPPAKTPEQIKAEQKDKDFKKAKDDLEKELTAKKLDPQQATSLLQYLTYTVGNVGLEVKDANALTHACLAKKMPLATDAMNGIIDKQKVATDPKTQKFDVKKFMTEFKKYIDSWKPAPSPSPVAPGAGGNR